MAYVGNMVNVQSVTIKCSRHAIFLYRAVTSKQIKLEIPAWSGFEGLEKIFPTVMWFFYLEFFYVAISPLEVKTYNCLTFHNQEGCLC